MSSDTPLETNAPSLYHLIVPLWSDGLTHRKKISSPSIVLLDALVMMDGLSNTIVIKRDNNFHYFNLTEKVLHSY